MNILVALDVSDASSCVPDTLARLPGLADAHVYLVHAAEPDPDFVGWEAGPESVRDDVAKAFRRQHRALEARAEALRARGLEVTALQIQGPAIGVILEQADKLDASMIVVGSHGHGAAYELLVGSTSSGVIRGAKVPVLVVPCRSPGGC